MGIVCLIRIKHVRHWSSRRLMRCVTNFGVHINVVKARFHSACAQSRAIHKKHHTWNRGDGNCLWDQKHIRTTQSRNNIGKLPVCLHSQSNCPSMMRYDSPARIDIIHGAVIVARSRDDCVFARSRTSDRARLFYLHTSPLLICAYNTRDGRREELFFHMLFSIYSVLG